MVLTSLIVAGTHKKKLLISFVNMHNHKLERTLNCIKYFSLLFLMYYFIRFYWQLLLKSKNRTFYAIINNIKKSVIFQGSSV